MFIEPLDGRTRVFYDLVPFGDVKAEVNVWWANKADPHEDAPEYHAYT